MATPPTKYKTDDELSVDEIVERQRALRRGEPKPRFVTEAFREYETKVLRAGGIEPEVDLDDLALEDMTPAEHFERIRRHR